MARVSFITPCFNQARLLPDAVQSIRAQTFRDWECIIVNCGSPDDTQEVAEGLIREYNDPRIRLIVTPDRALAGARNDAIRVSTGEWLACLDADDMVHPYYLEACFEALRRDRGGEGHKVLTVEGREFGASSGPMLPAGYDSRLNFDVLLSGNMFFYSSPYPRALWDLAGGYDPSPVWAEDWNFWITCSKFGYRTVHTPAPLFLYRKQAVSTLYAEFLKNETVGKAMVRSSQPDKYPPLLVLEAHKVIGTSGETARRRLNRIADTFPERPRPRLWQGVIAEADGRNAEAVALYEQARGLAEPDDWQPLIRLLLLAAKTGDSTLPEWKRRFREAYPGFPLAAQIEGVGAPA